jgi:Zn-dependent protease with chaperone function
MKNSREEKILTENTEFLLELFDDPDFLKLIGKSAAYAFMPIAVLIFLMTSLSSAIRNSTEENKSITNRLRDLLKDNEWSVKVIEEDDGIPNAFCISSKDIYISRSLIKMLLKRELEAVLLHEAYHVKASHTIKKIAIKYPIFALVLGLITSAGMAWYLVPVLFAIMTKIIKIPFEMITSRKMEINSDSFAVKYGYADELVSALTKIQKILKEIESKHQCDAMCQLFRKMDDAISTHPTLESRIKNILKKKEIYTQKLTLEKTKALVLKTA